MKTYNNLFDEITSEENIRAAIFEAAKHKKKMKSVRKALANADNVAKSLSKMLRDGTWNPPALHYTRIINDGVTLKERRIVCPQFVQEQVVHHAVLRVIFPIFQKKFYWWSCGSIPKHGREMALKKIQSYIWSHRAETKYFCKLDVHHFFDTIRPSKVFHELRRTISDKRVLMLLAKILRNNRMMVNGVVIKRGAPIGFYSSPFFANVLLNPVDHIVKDNDGIAVYFRYMDDMLLFNGNKRQMKRTADRIKEYLKSIKLELKYEIQIHKLDDHPVEFVGFTIFRDKTKLRAPIFLRSCRTCRKIAKKEYMTAYDAQRVLSYGGQFRYINGYEAFHEHILGNVNIGFCKELTKEKAKIRRLKNAKLA